MATAAINLQTDGTVREASGASINDISTSRTATGEYEVTGVLSIAQKGWRTSIPEDDNGDKMIRVAFADITDGVVVSVTDQSGAHIDIPDGRVLTLRFDVPEPESQAESV